MWLSKFPIALLSVCDIVKIVLRPTKIRFVTYILRTPELEDASLREREGGMDYEVHETNLPWYSLLQQIVKGSFDISYLESLSRNVNTLYSDLWWLGADDGSGSVLDFDSKRRRFMTVERILPNQMLLKLLLKKF